MSSRNDKPVGIEALTKVAELDAAEKAVMNANIETAAENASTAIETANTASENASTALSTANAVDAKATEALSTANTAKTTADGIDAKATEALSTANAASTTASTAATTAGTALTTANAAASTAANVSAVATEAKSLAQSANTTSNTALQAATAANTAISTINGNDTGMSMRQVAETVAAGLIKPKGSVAFASLPLLETTALGDMYEVTDAFITTADFKNGAGVSCDPGTEIYVVDVNGNKMWDLLGLKIDLSPFQKKELARSIGNLETVEEALARIDSINYSEYAMTWTQSSVTTGDWYTPVAFEYNGSVRLVIGGNGGIKYSDDGGTTWTQSSITSGRWYTPVAFEYNNSIRLVTASSAVYSGNGIKYSDDGGATWTQSSYAGNWFSPVAFEYNGSIRLVTGGDGSSYSGTGIIYSDDGGETWTQSSVTSGFWYTPVTFEYNGSVHLVTCSRGSGDGIKYSDDGGATWTQSSTTGYWYTPVAFEYNGSTRLVIGSSSTNSGIKYSDDGGATWTQSSVTSGDWYSIVAFEYNGSIRLVSSGRSIKYSDDGGATWTQSSTTSGSWYSLVAFEYNDSIRLVSCSGNGIGVIYSDDGGATWTQSSITSGSWFTPVAFEYNGYVRLVIGRRNGLASGIWYSDMTAIDGKLTVDKNALLSLANTMKSLLMNKANKPSDGGAPLCYGDKGGDDVGFLTLRECLLNISNACKTAKNMCTYQEQGSSCDLPMIRVDDSCWTLPEQGDDESNYLFSGSVSCHGNYLLIHLSYMSYGDLKRHELYVRCDNIIYEGEAAYASYKTWAEDLTTGTRSGYSTGSLRYDDIWEDTILFNFYSSCEFFAV